MSVADRLNRVRERIAEICHQQNRRPEEVTIVAVTKGQPVEAIQHAYQAGLRHFGENYWQEARVKFWELGRGEWVEEGDGRRFLPKPEDLSLQWHYIGRLQKNKIKDVVRFFTFIQSVDSLEQLQEIERRTVHSFSVFLQVDLFQEPQKGGIKAEQVLDFIEKVETMKKVRLVGLMTMGKADAPEAELRRKYASLKKLFDSLKTVQSDRVKLRYLSMGTSQDFPVALAAGSDMVRLGTTLFGRRRQ